MNSIWNETVHFEKRPELKKEIHTDVLIIGAGITGILCGYLLKKSGVNCVILEANRICGGQTKNTTAKITAQHSDIYHKLIKSLGTQKTKEYFRYNSEAINLFEKIAQSENISCRFERLPSYLYCTEENEKLEKEKRAYNELGIKHIITSETELPLKIQSAIKLENQAQFSPLEFLQPLSEKLEIYENTPVLKIERNTAFTRRARVTAEKIVFACHFPFVNFPGLYFARMHQERSYVISLENVPTLSAMYYGIDSDGLSFRSFENMILLGGGSHRTGKNDAGGKYDMLKENAKKLWANSKVVSLWSAQDCITGDGVPYIGQFSKRNRNFYVATGFNKWGMSSSAVAAQIISNSIVTGKNEKTVFSPQRSINFDILCEIFKDTAEAIKSISLSHLSFTGENPELLKSDKGAVCSCGKEKCGIYKDENGKEHKVSARCPHLGCELHFNGDDKTWECPCHGSRFSADGKILDEPAQKDI